MSASQRSLFENTPAGDAAEEAPRSRSLVFRAQPGRPLNKTERAFNRLVARVETLRNRLAAEVRRLNAALVYEAAHVRPRTDRVTGLRKALVLAIRPFLHDRRLKRGDRQALKTILAEQLDDVLAHDAAPDEDIKQLFEQLHGVSLDEFAREQIAEARSSMAEMFTDLGIDVDVPDLRAGMSEEEMAAAAAQMADSVRQADEATADRPKRRQTKREVREEARIRDLEDTRKTTLGAVYKRLAKRLHPDLEQNPDLRDRKSALMQQVTAAHTAGDLLALLRLESEWVNSDGARLTDETLGAYNRTLQEQVTELEYALAELPYSPRYQSLTRANGPFGMPQFIDGPEEVRRLDFVIEELSAGLARMEAGAAYEEVRGVLDDYRKAHRPGRRR